MAETTLPDCETRLLEAKLALHKLATGAQEVTLGYGDRQVQYRPANIEQLRLYVRELEQECGGDCAKRKPRQVIFG